jgi:uncharacterized protein (DUF1697 family)
LPSLIAAPGAQSGNALFAAEEEPQAADIERRITDEPGLSVVVILRTAGELRAVVRENPLEVPRLDRYGTTLQRLVA